MQSTGCSREHIGQLRAHKVECVWCRGHVEQLVLVIVINHPIVTAVYFCCSESGILVCLDVALPVGQL